MIQVEILMMQSINSLINDAIHEYVNSPRKEWVLMWPGMVVLCAATINWTLEVENAIERKSLSVCVMFFFFIFNNKKILKKDIH